MRNTTTKYNLRFRSEIVLLQNCSRGASQDKGKSQDIGTYIFIDNEVGIVLLYKNACIHTTFSYMITKMSVMGCFFLNSIGLYSYSSYYYYSSGSEKEVRIKMNSLPNLHIHKLLDTTVTCMLKSVM